MRLKPLDIRLKTIFFIPRQIILKPVYLLLILKRFTIRCFKQDILKENFKFDGFNHFYQKCPHSFTLNLINDVFKLIYIYMIKQDIYIYICCIKPADWAEIFCGQSGVAGVVL